VSGNRKSLLWLLGPPTLYLVALPFTNRLTPVLFGVPFSVLWLLFATLCTPLFGWLAARRDPLWTKHRRDRS
jgi:hypothetical protein